MLPRMRRGGSIQEYGVSVLGLQRRKVLGCYSSGVGLPCGLYGRSIKRTDAWQLGVLRRRWRVFHRRKDGVFVVGLAEVSKEQKLPQLPDREVLSQTKSQTSQTN